MTLLLWSKMPSKWIADNELKIHFSSTNMVSDDIAALKIFIALCFFSKEVDSSAGQNFIRNFEAKVTYEQIIEMCSLSRALVSRGIKKLKSVNLVTVKGVRSKTYILRGSTNGWWCKLPKRALVKNDEKMPALYAFLNRYPNERDALKLFLYIISCRSNSKRYVDLTRGTIAEKTGIVLDNIDAALGVLTNTGLMSIVEDRGYKAQLARSKKVSSYADSGDRLHRYWVIGYESLNYKTYSVESEDCFVRHPDLYLNRF